VAQPTAPKYKSLVVPPSSCAVVRMKVQLLQHTASSFEQPTLFFDNFVHALCLFLWRSASHNRYGALISFDLLRLISCTIR
jgi:hypothetical protein